MKRILTVIGARPQFIKAAPLSKAIRNSGYFEEIILHTGQHFDEKMSDIFFREMEIPRPDYRFDIHSMNHGAMTGMMLQKIEGAIFECKPDLVLVYGDTNSTLAGALAAAKQHIPVAHVEAGLRSYDMRMPEEINRILTDRISSYLFCPTSQAVTNLEKEGFSAFPCKVFRTGDIMLDSMNMFASISANRSDQDKNTWWPGPEPYILVTVHRAENTDNPQRLKSVIQALEKINEKIKVILPLHPRTRSKIEQTGLQTNLTITEPLGYLDMIALLKNCSWVMTDSGGLQKEAYFMKKYCITLRDNTEWTELLECGANILAGTEVSNILEAADKISGKEFQAPEGLYGNGQTAKQIVEMLSRELNEKGSLKQTYS